MQRNCSYDIEDVFIMQKPSIITVCLQKLDVADKLKAEIFNLFYFSIPTGNIETEQYSNIPQYIACYSYEKTARKSMQ